MDVFEAIELIKPDVGIFFPPCTDLAVSGSGSFEEKIADGRQQASIDFFMKVVNAPVEKIAIENPIGIMSTIYRKPDQIVQPYYFGDPYQKSTCLWLKNLPKLYYNLSDNLFEKKTSVEPEYIIYKSSKTKSGTSKYSKFGKLGKGKGHERSKTPTGLARAIAIQWGGKFIIIFIMKNKIKTYVIMVSRTFPAYHPQKGEPTYFVEKILSGIIPFGLLSDNEIEKVSNFNLTKFHCCDPKIHTFRGNFSVWKKRIDAVLAGDAVIVLKYHTLGKYVKGNKQIEFARLDKDSGVGVQEAIYQSEFEQPYDGMAIKCEGGIFRDFPFYLTAENDGLSQRDFRDWFEKGKYDLTKPMACIHFTSFRYGRTTLPTEK